MPIGKAVEKETMVDHHSSSGDGKVYRFKRFYTMYHLAAGAAAVVGAVLTYQFVIPPVALGLFAIFMIARPFRLAVIVGHDSVTLRGMFSEKSIQRSSVTAVEFKAAGKSHLLILWGDLDRKKKLTIPDLFAFDEAWNDWCHSHRNLSDNQLLTLF